MLTDGVTGCAVNTFYPAVFSKSWHHHAWNATLDSFRHEGLKTPLAQQTLASGPAMILQLRCNLISLPGYRIQAPVDASSYRKRGTDTPLQSVGASVQCRPTHR